jgi:hypothetical protein
MRTVNYGVFGILSTEGFNNLFWVLGIFSNFECSILVSNEQNTGYFGILLTPCPAIYWSNVTVVDFENWSNGPVVEPVIFGGVNMQKAHECDYSKD